MKYLSICSGIEAASAAWETLGWSPVAFAENEAFPSALLAHHYPHVPNWGDITKFKEWPDAAFDVLVGGTPCQSFSVAGLRKGMADPRGNLCLTYLAIADRYRPQWLVWENVPGVLSSAGGRDFGAFIGGLEQLGYHAAWRVLDAQYVRVDGLERAVPQRRRRVFVVGCFGDWRRAAAVLFERESLRWDHPPGRKAGERTASTIAGCSNGGGANGPGCDVDSTDTLVAKSIKASDGGIDREEAHTLIAEDVAWCLQERDHKGPDSSTKEGHLIVVADPISANEARTYTHEGKNNFRTHNVIAVQTDVTPKAQDDVAFTLKQPSPSGGGQPQAVLPFDTTKITHSDNRATRDKDGAPSDICPPLTKETDKGDQDPLVFQTRIARNGRGQPDNVVPALNGADAGTTSDMRPCIANASAVRRLTPRECERLQGFKDDYTLIPYRNKPAADGPRYKALGNSMAVNCMRWLGTRIQMVSEIEEKQ